MKKFLLILIIILAGYFLYVGVIAPPAEKASEKVKEEVFDKPYSQIAAAKQSEAKQLAKILMNKQHTYYAVEGKYASSMSKLRFTPRLGQYYTAKIVRADENNYLIEIKGNIDNDNTMDIWEVDKDGFKNVINDVQR
ncbi:hypothetical protein DRQ33_00595 [bacterium]|nr:MAG: hypothetical protein DRQ33_00595 [bacterium]